MRSLTSSPDRVIDNRTVLANHHHRPSPRDRPRFPAAQEIRHGFRPSTWRSARRMSSIRKRRRIAARRRCFWMWIPSRWYAAVARLLADYVNDPALRRLVVPERRHRPRVRQRVERPRSADRGELVAEPLPLVAGNCRATLPGWRRHRTTAVRTAGVRGRHRTPRRSGSALSERDAVLHQASGRTAHPPLRADSGAGRPQALLGRGMPKWTSSLRAARAGWTSTRIGISSCVATSRINAAWQAMRWLGWRMMRGQRPRMTMVPPQGETPFVTLADTRLAAVSGRIEGKWRLSCP